jgi:hypothetical protein
MATEIGPFPLPKRMAFRCDDEHKLIAIADIEAPPPKERVRVLRILEAIRDNTYLPPILLKYLVHGEHRYWCSRAVGSTSCQPPSSSISTPSVRIIGHAPVHRPEPSTNAHLNSALAASSGFCHLTALGMARHGRRGQLHKKTGRAA